jgi:putative SOS response-associated peptidase YedK
LTFAGLWGPLAGLEKSGLVTTDADAVVKPVHHRVPVNEHGVLMQTKSSG